MSRSFSRRGVLAAGAGLLGAGLVPMARAAQAPRLAAVLTGSVTEAWAGSVHRAALAAASAGAVRYDWAGNVPHADGASAIRRAAEAGADLVVADVFGAEQTARAVAAEFPGTAFLFGSSFGPDAEAANVAVFDSRIDEACHLAGIVAGAVTVTGHIGLVADYPLRGVNQLMHAFATGAREVRPGLVFEAGFTASPVDPCDAGGLATGMIARGADVLFGAGSAGSGVRDAAALHGVTVIGCLDDAACGSGRNADVVAASAVWDAGPTLAAALARVCGGAFGPEDLGGFSAMMHGGCALTGTGIVPGRVAGRMDERARILIARRADEMRAGRFALAEVEHQPDGMFS